MSGALTPGAPTPLILGVDPGFASFGWVLVELGAQGERVLSMGVVRTAKDTRKGSVLATEDNLRRARILAHALGQIIGDGPGIVAIAAEAMSFPRSSSVAAKVAMTWGVLAAWAERLRLPILQASPQRTKLASAGAASASKADVQRALEARYGVLPLVGAGGTHEHQVDALAAVVAALDSDVVRIARRMAA